MLFLLNPTVYTVGTQARAYGLAIAAVMASSWFLYSWAEIARARVTLLGVLTCPESFYQS
jgi:hypothetical protein